jgi:hypothetical protein
MPVQIYLTTSQNNRILVQSCTVRTGTVSDWVIEGCAARDVGGTLVSPFRTTVGPVLRDRGGNNGKIRTQKRVKKRKKQKVSHQCIHKTEGGH